MKSKIDYKKFKEDPDFYLSKLDKEAEEEFVNLLEFIFYKYQINVNLSSEKKKKKEDSMSFFKNNPIKLPEGYKFNREEAHER
jgi:hypothetical protein